eukprot:1158932-Pelagomonas_calceolata.AAC.2
MWILIQGMATFVVPVRIALELAACVCVCSGGREQNASGSESESGSCGNAVYEWLRRCELSVRRRPPSGMRAAEMACLLAAVSPLKQDMALGWVWLVVLLHLCTDLGVGVGGCALATYKAHHGRKLSANCLLFCKWHGTSALPFVLSMFPRSHLPADAQNIYAIPIWAPLLG